MVTICNHSTLQQEVPSLGADLPFPEITCYRSALQPSSCWDEWTVVMQTCSMLKGTGNSIDSDYPSLVGY